METSRQDRGLQLASSKRIKKIGPVWVVPSQSHGGTYVVNPDEGSCTCPDHETRQCKCKHIYAVEYARHQVIAPDGTTFTAETMKITYSQNWSAYNDAQTHEKERVEALLKALCGGIVQPPQGRGRPRLPLSDVVYSAVLKVYTTWSGRRASTDIRECAKKKHIDRAPHYNSIFNYLGKPELTPLLKVLIEESAAPLKAVETKFSVDSTNFATSVYARWFDHKYGRDKSEHEWVRAHAMVGTRTNIVTSVEVTYGDGADCPELPGLVATTAKTFDVKEVSADKAYLSHKNLEAIESVKATPYIPFKDNSRGEGPAAWQRLWHLFWFKRTEFLQHYHQRSNVETTFDMIKKKFGGAIRSKTFIAQVNEILAKVLCHNLAVLVHEMSELGIDPIFWKAGTAGVLQ